jgi:hypothetical protein
MVEEVEREKRRGGGGYHRGWGRDRLSRVQANEKRIDDAAKCN